MEEEKIIILKLLKQIINDIPEKELPIEDRSEIDIITNKNNSISYKAYDNILLKVTYQVNSKFFELRKVEEIDYEFLLEKFYNVKNDESSLYYKITFDSVDDIKKVAEEIKAIYRYLNSIEKVVSFGCCSKYIECSDNKKCVNTIREIRKGCIYKKNLEEGRIFYGKNSILSTKKIQLKRYTIIDTENPNSKCDSICSISLISVNNGVVEIEKEYLVNPEAEFDYRNINIHHITPDMVKDKPTFKELWKEIEKYFTNSVIIAHNAQSADLSKICKVLTHYEEEIPDIYYIDTCRLARETFPNLESYGLKNLSEYLGIELGNHHNSLCDTKACYEILKEIAKVRVISESDVKKYTFELNRNSNNRLKESEIRKKMNELAGLIAGITVDEVIKTNEVEYLKKWLEENNSYRKYEFFDVIIPIVENILSDSIITDDEKKILLRIYDYVIMDEYLSNTKTLQILNGIIKGIICDNELTLEEIQGLNIWLKENEQLKGNYPYDKIYETVERVLEDNYITEYEKEKLIRVFNTFINPTDVEKEIKDYNFEQKNFVLTGDFMHGTKNEIADIIQNNGGIVLSGVNKKVNYVVVGSNGSKDWSFGNFGTKVKRALELKEKGLDIDIISEEELFKIIKK